MKTKFIIFITIAILLLASLVIFKMDSSTKVKLETNHGNIVIALYSDMPTTTGNFKI